ncbi:hypothetical protein [Pseudarthrobacter sp. C4D7]|uniref:hypothetical protein n=1 Tax=Pseudarthrobacter sp. C4D7 TaxID=2735268 RepID=UPI0015847481|nr:hypothetical protein [Pseudarthrobacter sp. C4D7]NUT70600.1 hypothetical protein [Pseudarthrobacter sp. C4D7]
MFLRDLYDSLRRRWYIVAAGILITAAIAGLAYGQSPVKYEASGSVALVPPATAVISGDNPFLYMGGLEQALGVLIVKLNSPEVQHKVSDNFPDTEYTAVREPSTNGPIVRISVSGPNATETLSVLRQVLGSVPENLTSLQDALNLSAASRMTSLPLSQDDEAVANGSGRSRTLLALAAVGIAGTVILTGQLDKVLLRRRRDGVPPNVGEPSVKPASPRKEDFVVEGPRHVGAGAAGRRNRTHGPTRAGSGAGTNSNSRLTDEDPAHGREHVDAAKP